MAERNDLTRKHAHPTTGQARNRVRLGLVDVGSALMVRGVLAVVLGIIALVWPALSLRILVLAVGIYCLVDGVAIIVGALRVKDRGGYLVQALISLGIGALLVLWPGESARALLVLFGIWAAFTGISQIVAARRLPADDPERKPLTTVGAVALGIGAVLILWPGSGVVAISWAIAIAALLIGGVLIYLAMRVKRLGNRISEGRH